MPSPTRLCTQREDGEGRVSDVIYKCSVLGQGSEGSRAWGRESVCGGQGSRIQGKAAEEGTGFPKTDGIDFARVGVHFA